VRALGATQVDTRGPRSDNGNLVMDARFGTIADPPVLAAALAATPGIVEHGIFLGSTVERVVIAGTDGLREAVNETF
jgi:ribose 5-phosphate isomerase A